MSESIKGKVAVISGVASGFAKATAELFAKEGCNLVMFDLNAEGLAATAAACEKLGAKVVSFVGDATKQGTFETVLSKCLSSFGKVDFLINYAGGAVKVRPSRRWTTRPTGRSSI